MLIEPTTKIQNVVATVTTGQIIDLDEIVATMPNIQYDPSQFPGLVYRLEKPKTATLIFDTGKMVCTGGKSKRDSKRAVLKIIRNLDDAGIKITGKPVLTVQNIVASGDLGVSVRLEEAAMTLENSMYEPEQFPGLIHRMKDPKTVILVFGTGKIVITGAKFESQVPEAAMKIKERLFEIDLLNMDDED
ncbi:MAG: TATA-box-binding protein [Candidatus Thorarchaeota archaeon]